MRLNYLPDDSLNDYAYVNKFQIAEEVVPGVITCFLSSVRN